MNARRTVPVLVVAVAALAVSGGHGRVSGPPDLVQISSDNGTTAALVSDGRVVTTLQADDGYYPARARDGSLIAWIDNGWLALRVATPDGKRRAFVRGVQSFAWSSAGHQLLMAMDKGGRLEVLDPASGHARDVTPSLKPRSPVVIGWVQADRMVYEQTSSDPHCRDIMAADLSQGAPSQLATVCYFGALGGDDGLLSPDGRRLLVVSAHTRSGRPSYTTVDVARGTRTVIARPAGAVRAFWGPGDRVGFVVRDGGRERVVSTGVDGRRTTTLAALAPGEQAGSDFLTSPDGRRLAFVVTTATRDRVVTVGANGHLRTIGTSSGRRIFARCWFNDGTIAVTTKNGLRTLETRDQWAASLHEVFRAPRGAFLIELSCS